ncbi:unnamed protein product [Ectocarpus sp. CCAP 1310/34]|nr:unnamed protein product [Ectocarpus sp. CCAP 1310/34]
MAEYEKESSPTSRSHARFEVKAAGWDDKPIVKGTTETIRAWIVNQPWWTPPLDGPTLDFGCGTGCLTMALRDDLGESVTGVDTSRAMLEQFDRKAEGRGVTTVAVELTGPGQLGEGADDSFALAYSSLTLHHIRDCERTVSALAGYLRPGSGRLVLFDLEATEDAHKFHPADFELGNQLEHHGIRESDLRAWCESSGMLEDLSVDRIGFSKGEGEDGAFGTGREFTLLAATCVRKAEGAEQREARRSSIAGDLSDGCLACNRREAEYECVPCGCHAFCRGCAMKVATGGRCKRCKNMFVDLKRLR